MYKRLDRGLTFFMTFKPPCQVIINVMVRALAMSIGVARSLVHRRFRTDIHGPHKMTPEDFGDHLAF